MSYLTESPPVIIPVEVFMSQSAGTMSETPNYHNLPERRAYVRYVRLRDAHVRTGVAPTRIFGVAVIRQISINGLHLFLNARVQEGTILEVSPRGIDFPRSLIARVVHMVPQANGWMYGCELTNSLSDEELRLLLS
jgi:hypothetical protein